MRCICGNQIITCISASLQQHASLQQIQDNLRQASLQQKQDNLRQDQETALSAVVLNTSYFIDHDNIRAFLHKGYAYMKAKLRSLAQVLNRVAIATEYCTQLRTISIATSRHSTTMMQIGRKSSPHDGWRPLAVAACLPAYRPLWLHRCPSGLGSLAGWLMTAASPTSCQ